ncbi:replication initiator protein [Flyfo microvirus Tbat2_98]|nr:replication initiator protein [Flyfo microvirus Tbat2_98]
MCVNPSILSTGQAVACRQCWQCRENRIQDWVGRGIAEARTATRTLVVTLTYGGGSHERSTVLTYSDVQKYFKRLRKAGYKFKYLIAGEYGEAKGRCHWHGILFFHGKSPEVKLRERVPDQFWNHGVVFWDDPNPKALRYVCKYVTKNIDEPTAQGHFAMSKKPPIGSEYFKQQAHAYARAGVSPQDFKYTFPENRDKNGDMVAHYMHGATARDFCAAFVEAWQLLHGNDRWPPSAILDGTMAFDIVGEEQKLVFNGQRGSDGYMDKHAQHAPPLAFETRHYGVKPGRMPRDGAEPKFSDAHNLYYCDIDGSRYYWRKTINNPDREWAWHDRERKEIPFGYLNPRDGSHVPTPSETLRAKARANMTMRQRDGELRLQAQAESKANSKRLPMVGDPGWSPRPRERQ